MNTRKSNVGLAARLAVAIALALSAAAAVPTHGEEFLATLIDMETGGSTSVVIRVDQYSTDAEVAKLKQILGEKGQDGLRDSLWDLEKGHIRVGAGLGYPIAVARQRVTESGRVVRLGIVRPLSFRELISGARSTDYPFTRIELELDKEGKGEGEMIAAAKVSIDDDGTIEIESYAARPLRLLNVRRE